jgi:hypothetical protein
VISVGLDGDGADHPLGHQLRGREPAHDLLDRGGDGALAGELVLGDPREAR